MIVNKDFRKRVDFVMRQGWKNIEKMYNNEASKYDVTFSIGFTLISIDPENGSPSTSIGPIMGLESNSISRILNSMENKNLITRRPNPNDGRSIIISLTKLGLRKIDHRSLFFCRRFSFNNRVTPLIQKYLTSSSFTSRRGLEMDK